MKYLILGGYGQLAQEFVKRLQSNANDEIMFIDRDVCDITNPDELNSFVTKFSPDYILNCAAYNLVDLAESEDKEIAYKVNKEAPAHIAKICAEKNIFLVHFSTDYVFDGSITKSLYSEDDTPAPLGHYGQSKLEGEEEVARYADKYLIFRTSWVYGNSHQNFIYKLKSWVKNTSTLAISCDEFSIPTSTKTLVDVTMKALSAELNGLYHVTNSGFCSRYEWVKEFLAITKQDVTLYPALRSDFNLAAKRPFFSAMSNRKISEELNIQIPSWQDSLREFLLENKN